MERLALRTTFCVCLLLLALGGTKGQQSQCQNGWFGDKCQYQCHCLYNAVCDKVTGECPGDCDRRWFGPQCQYLDAAFHSNYQLTDGIESTCLVGFDLSQYFPMLDDVLFTWMRVVTNRPGLFDRDHMNITFLSRSGAEVAQVSLTRIYSGDTILYLYGELEDRFKTIRLDFDTPETRQSFCTMQVSSGRNVAIKQNASQTGTWGGGVAERAVDGKLTQRWDQGSCTSTRGGNDSPYWTVDLSLPVIVNMYTILGRSEVFALCRLRYFRLESYIESTQVQQYDERDLLDQFSYDVYPVNTSPITSVKLTVSKYFWPSQQFLCNNGNPSLSFCEMQIYGDVVCQPNTWGRDCEKNCNNCQDPSDSCFVSTGMCTSGCKAGFHGLGCHEECAYGRWGVNCLNRCDNCLNGNCNKSSGECMSGCVQGYKLPYCVEECDPGFHGFDCEEFCPENCKDICNNVDGTCTKCVTGYQGPMCNKECDATFYGEDCATSCSDMCIDQLCHHITGVCNNCPDGKQISVNCSKDCAPGFFGPRCANQCSEHCGGDGFCNNINGSCLNGCKPGYRSDSCGQTCAHTTYGEGCNKTCNVHCMVNTTQEPAICEHVTGQCILGCQSGYSGITCEEISSESDEINLAIIVIPILLVIILIVAIIFGIWFRRRKKAQKTERVGTVGGAKKKPNVVLENGIHLELGIQTKQSPSHLSQNTSSYEMAEEVTPNEMTKETNEDEVNVYINTPEMQVKFSKTAIPVESLGEYLVSHNMDFFTKQFQSVPECRATTIAADSSVNKHKNRYKNIPAYDHSRVHLKVDPEKKQGDYYNANFIQGFDGSKYIAAQAPNKGVLADFIRMIWEQEVDVVVMLTKLAEEGKAKCECYWPINDANEVTFGEITVKLAATQVLADYTKRTLQLTKNDGQSHCVTQFHFTSWPDKGVPETPWALVDFEQVVNYHYDSGKPLLIHCSAGVGRTGTFIALRNALKEAKVTGYIDCYQTVAKMRQDRIFMIQTAEQYRFLHDAAQVALLCQDALMTSDALDDRMKVLMEVTETGETNMEKEFKMVCDLVRKEHCNDSGNEATDYVNNRESVHSFMTNIKNRFSDLLANKEHRPRLSFTPNSENDYINAVLVPSMTKQDQQVLTQLPLPDTVEDFWRLVTQYNVSLILAFDSDMQNQDKPVGDYLPKHNKPLDCGTFEISGDEVKLGSFCEKQAFRVQSKSKGKDSWLVHHIKCTKTKLDTEDWLILMNELHSMAPLRDARTIYMCINGADQSGFACILSLLISRVEHDHFLTVPLVVGAIKFIRPEVIPNKDQYCSLYKILQLHCEMSHVYTNFTPHATQKIHTSGKSQSKPKHVDSKTIFPGESEEMSPDQKMPAIIKVSAGKTALEGQSQRKEKTKSSKF